MEPERPHLSQVFPRNTDRTDCDFAYNHKAFLLWALSLYSILILQANREIGLLRTTELVVSCLRQ